jgi:DNA-directed RNA polymerase subunit RPC12/RpoP
MQNYNCKNCGAELFWDTQAGCLKCQYCDSEYQAEDFTDQTIDPAAAKDPETIDAAYASTEVEDGMVLYKCGTCGGEVVALPTTMATICPYCGEAISITSKSAGIFRPEMCIPFKQSKKEIVEIYTQYVNKSLLTPKEFKEESTIEKITGLFAPFYLHDVSGAGDYVFAGETTTSRKRGDDKITTHKVYDLSVRSFGEFNKIPTDASVKLENTLMEAIEPYKYEDSKDYNPAYMAGFVAEQGDDDKSELNERAETRFKTGLREKAKSLFSGYSGITVKSENVNISKHDSQYVMLPVWMLNVKHGDKKYTFAINGQTGKVSGKLPMSGGKLALIGGIVLGTVDIIAALISVFV